MMMQSCQHGPERNFKEMFSTSCGNHAWRIKAVLRQALASFSIYLAFLIKCCINALTNAVYVTPFVRACS